MASNANQVRALVNRLYDRTLAKEMQWQPSIEPGKYQARIGDYVVNIGPFGAAAIGSQSIVITVTRLDGIVVEKISDRFMIGNFTNVPSDMTAKLGELYALIHNGNSDIEKLLDMLG